MKKKLLLMISVLLIILCLGFGASAEDVTDIELARPSSLAEQRPYTESETIKIIDHVVYRLCDNGYLGTEADGNTGKFYEVCDWFDTTEAAKTVTEINIVSEINGIEVKAIQSSITEGAIGYFDENNYSVKKITIPETIVYIGKGLFSILDGLEDLMIPASVTEIYRHYDSGYRAWDFVEMESLRKVTFMGDIEKVGGFENCKKLEEVIFKGAVKEIMNGAFYNCKSLKTFSIPDTVEVIGSIAFSKSGLTSIRIPASVKHIYSAFSNCKKLSKVIFEDDKRDSLTIGQAAFSNCTSLEKVYLPKSVKKIIIGHTAFYNCKKLTKVYNTINVTHISHEAFNGCSSLKSFVIGNKTDVIAKDAFKNCTSLKKITFTGGKKTLPEIKKKAFAKTKNVKFTVKNKNTAEALKAKLMKSGLKKSNFRIVTKTK